VCKSYSAEMSMNDMMRTAHVFDLKKLL